MYYSTCRALEATEVAVSSASVSLAASGSLGGLGCASRPGKVVHVHVSNMKLCAYSNLTHHSLLQEVENRGLLVLNDRPADAAACRPFYTRHAPRRQRQGCAEQRSGLLR